MPTASYVKIAGALEVLQEAVNAGSDQWAIALTNTVPPSASFVSGTTDLTTSGGYTAGGNNVATTSSAEAAGTFKLVLVDPAVWTGSGGGFTFRYAILVNKTVLTGANGTCISYWDYGSSQAVAAGETVTIDLDATNGTYQMV